jgi:hypothetical protein
LIDYLILCETMCLGGFVAFFKFKLLIKTQSLKVQKKPRLIII